MINEMENVEKNILTYSMKALNVMILSWMSIWIHSLYKHTQGLHVSTDYCFSRLIDSSKKVQKRFFGRLFLPFNTNWYVFYIVGKPD